jgi:hypothetical protein
MARYYQVRVNALVVFEGNTTRAHAHAIFLSHVGQSAYRQGEPIELWMESRWEGLAWVRINFIRRLC